MRNEIRNDKRLTLYAKVQPSKTFVLVVGLLVLYVFAIFAIAGELGVCFLIGCAAFGVWCSKQETANLKKFKMKLKELIQVGGCLVLVVIAFWFFLFFLMQSDDGGMKEATEKLCSDRKELKRYEKELADLVNPVPVEESKAFHTWKMYKKGIIGMKVDGISKVPAVIKLKMGWKERRETATIVAIKTNGDVSFEDKDGNSLARFKPLVSIRSLEYFQNKEKPDPKEVKEEIARVNWMIKEFKSRVRMGRQEIQYIYDESYPSSVSYATSSTSSTSNADWGSSPSSWPVEQYLKSIAHNPKSIKASTVIPAYKTGSGWIIVCDCEGTNVYGGTIVKRGTFRIQHLRVVEAAWN